MSTDNEKILSFEKGIERLAEINRALDQDDLELEKMLRLYQEGIRLSRTLTAQLDMTDQQILRIEEEEGCEEFTQPVDGDVQNPF